MNKKKSILNISTDIIGKLVTLIIGIVLPKLYIDSFGSEINGLLSSINNILIYVNLLEAGVGGASIQALYKAIGKNSQRDINGILAATDKFYKKTGCYFFAIVCILAFLYPVCIKSDISFFTVSALILLSAIPAAIKYFFQGKYTILLNADNRAYILNTTTMVGNILINIIKIILILLGYSVIVVQISFAFVSIFQMIIIVLYVKRRYPLLNFSVTPNVLAIDKKKYVMVHSISSTIFANIDILVLTLFTDLKVVSIYTIYNMVFSQINQIAKSVSNGMNASFGQLYYRNREEFIKQYQIFAVIYRYFALTLITITGVLILPFMKIYASSFHDANYIDQYLPILFLSSNILDAIRWPEVLATNTTGHFKDTALAAGIETVINLICSVVFVWVFGIYGVLIGTIIALLYRTIDMIRFVSVHIIEKNYKKEVLYVILSWIVSICFTLLSYKIELKANDYIELICVAVKVGVIIGIVHFVFSLLFYFNTYINLIRRKGKGENEI